MTITPFRASRLSPHPARRTGGLSSLIEGRLETPVFLVVSSTLVIRAAQTFSGGTLVMAHFLGPLFPPFEAITGLGLGLGSEMLAAIAGRTWRHKQREAAEIASRPGLPKVQRTSLVRRAEAEARHAFAFMCVGIVSSLYTGISFLISNSLASGGRFDWGAAATDLITTAVITAVVLFLGVFKEPASADATQALLADIDDGMNAALHAAIARFTAGLSTDADHRFIAEHLPAHRAAKFRRAVAKVETGRMWKAADIRRGLGLGNDAKGIRDLNRQINTLAKTPENGLEKAADGRTWLIPHRTVMEVWAEEMARQSVRMEGSAGQPMTPARTLNGGSIMYSSGAEASLPDTHRADAGLVPELIGA